MAFCAITDNDKINLVKITNHILNRNIESLADFKGLSKTAYQIIISKNATPEKAATLVSLLPETITIWRDRKSELGDPIDKKYKAFIDDILKFSKSTLTDYNSVLKFLDIEPKVEVPEEIPVVLVEDNQNETISEVDKYVSSTSAEIVKVTLPDGTTVNRRSINGVIFDTRVTNISTIGYYDNTENREEEELAAPLKHGNTIDFIGKEIFLGRDVQFSDVPSSEKSITKESFDSIKDFFLKLKNDYEQKGFKFRTGITVYDPVTKISGEIDLLLIDKTGRMYVSDFKTTFGKYTERLIKNSVLHIPQRTKPLYILSKEQDYSTQMYIYSLLLDKIFPGKVDTSNFIVFGIGLKYDTDVDTDSSVISNIVNLETFNISNVRKEFKDKNLKEIKETYDKLIAENYEPSSEINSKDDAYEDKSPVKSIFDPYVSSIVDVRYGEYEYSSYSNTIFLNKYVVANESDIFKHRIETGSLDPVISFILTHIDSRKFSDLRSAENNHFEKIKEINIKKQGPEKIESEKRRYESEVQQINEKYSKQREEVKSKRIDVSKLKTEIRRRSLDRLKLIDDVAATSEEMKVEIDWLKSTFGEIITLKVFDAVNSDLNGQVLLNTVKLWQNASIGTGYHEGWHVFSQLFLTFEEKVKLYDSIKKSGINIKVRKPGGVTETKNSKTATYLEIEEFLADEFAKYGLNSDTYNFKKIFKKEEEGVKNIFQKLWNALKRLFGYKTNEESQETYRTIELYFKDLKIGNLSNYDASMDNAMFIGPLNSLTESTNQNIEIIRPERLHLYSQTIDSLIREELSQYKKVFESFNTDAKLRRNVFNNIYVTLRDRLQSTIDGTDPIPLTELQKQEIYNILKNWPDFLYLYKSTSAYSFIQKLQIEKEVRNSQINSEIIDGLSDFSDQDEALEQNEQEDDYLDETMSMSEKQFGDKAANEESPISKAERSVKDYLRSVPSGKKNELGYDVGSDPYDLFYRIKRHVSGLYDFDKFLQKLSDPAMQALVPELKVIVEDLKNITNNVIGNSAAATANQNRTFEEVKFLLSFHGSLNLPEVKNMQLRIDLTVKDKLGLRGTRSERVTYSQLTRAVTAKIIRRWMNDFSKTTNTKIIDPSTNKPLVKKYFTTSSINQNFDIYDPNNNIYLSEEKNDIYLNIFSFTRENVDFFSKNDVTSLENFFSIFSITFDPRVFQNAANIKKLIDIRNDMLTSLSDLEIASTERLYFNLVPIMEEFYKEDFDRINSMLNITNQVDKKKPLNERYSERRMQRRRFITEVFKLNIPELNMALTSEGYISEDIRSKRTLELPGFTKEPLRVLRFRNHEIDIDEGEITLKIKNHYYDIMQLGEMQEFFGDDVSSGRFVVDDRAKYPYYNTTQLLLISNLLNQVTDRQSIQDNPHLVQISPNLPWMRKNFFYSSMFEKNGERRKVDGQNVELIVEDIASFQVIRRDSNDKLIFSERPVTKLTKQEKILFDVLTLLQGGALEVRRAEVSPSIMSMRLSNYNGKEGNLPLSISSLTSTVSGKPMSESLGFFNYLQNLVIAEYEKMFWYRENYAGKLEKFSNQLNIFENIISPDLKKSIEEKVQEAKDNGTDTYEIFTNNLDIKNKLKEELDIYFQNEIKDFTKLLDTLTEAEKKTILSVVNLGATNITNSLQTVSKIFILNRFILRAEFDNLVFGDLYYYSNPTKRGKIITNHGVPFYIDSVKNAILNKLNKQSLGSIYNRQVVPENKDFSIVKSGFIEDIVMQSNYHSSGNLLNNLIKVNSYYKLFNEADLERFTADLKKKINPYSEIKATDGQGIISLDFYRMFAIVARIWTPEMENEYDRQLAIFRYKEYQNKNNLYVNIDGSQMEGEQLELALKRDEDLLKRKPFASFVPLKASYTGPMRRNGGPLTPIYDKFSLRPIIPEQAYGRRDENLMREMIKNSIDYLKFESGSKVHVEGKIDWIKKEGEEYVLNNYEVTIDDKTQTHELTGGFLKHQLNTFESSTVNIYGSQFRKIFYDPAERIKGISEYQPLFDKLMKSKDRVVNLTNRLINIQENDLLNLLGIEKIDRGVDPDNKPVFEYKINDLEKFIRVIQEQGIKDGFTTNASQYLQYDPATGKAKFPIDFAFNKNEIQELLSGMIDKSLRRLKVQGTTMIQVSGIGWERVPLRNPTDEELDRYGSIDLPYYNIIYDSQGNPIRTGKMGVKIPLIADFENLLNLKNPEGQDIKVYHINSNGNEVIDYEESINRLNEAMQNPDWKEKHMDLLTIVGYRIPTSNISLIDHIEVMEFLPPSAGNIIIAPIEQIIKAGSDFDIDSMKMIFPSISKEGQFVTESMLDGITEQDIFNKMKDLSLTEFELRDIKKTITNRLKDNRQLSQEDIKKLSSAKYRIGNQVIKYIVSLNEELGGTDLIEDALFEYYSRRYENAKKLSEEQKRNIISDNVKRAKKRLSKSVFFDEEDIENISEKERAEAIEGVLKAGERESIVDLVIKFMKKKGFSDLSFQQYEEEFMGKEPGDVSPDAKKADQYYSILKRIEEIEKERRGMISDISDYNIDLDIFEKRTLLKRAITNSILKEYSASLSEPLYYPLLVMPTGQDIVNDVANNMIAIKANLTEDQKRQQLEDAKGKLFDKKYSVVQNFTASREYEVWDNVIGRRKDLGGWAIHRTYASIFNLINFTMKNNFIGVKYGVEKTTFTPLIPKNRRAEWVTYDDDNMGRIKMHGKDLDGNYISDTLDQLTTSAIDLVNIPSYPHLSINKLNKKVAAYLIQQGIPLKTVSLFLEQPILIEAYDLFDRKSRDYPGYTFKHALVEVAQRYGLLNEKVSRKTKFGVIQQPVYQVYQQEKVSEDNADKRFEITPEGQVPVGAITSNIPNLYLRRPQDNLSLSDANGIQAIFGFNTYLSDDVEFLPEQLENAIRLKGRQKENPSSVSTPEINEFKELQRMVLSYFGSIQEEASYLADLQFAFNSDTTKYGTLASAMRSIERRGEISGVKRTGVYKSKIFDDSQIKLILSKTMIAPFDYTEKVIKILTELFPSIYNKENKETINRIINSTFGKNEYIERVSKNIDSDYIEFIYKNFGKYNKQNFSAYFRPKIKNLESSDEFFAIKLISILKKFPELAEKIDFVSRLSSDSYKVNPAEISDELLKGRYHSDALIWNIYLERDSENSTSQKNNFISEWRSLINFSPKRLGLEKSYSVQDSKEISEFFTELAYFSFYQSGATNVGDNFSDVVPVEIWTDFIVEAFNEAEKFFMVSPTMRNLFLEEFEIRFKENNPKLKWNSDQYDTGEIDNEGKPMKKNLLFDPYYAKGKDYYVKNQFVRLEEDPFAYLKEKCK